jgi:phosphatidylinositol-3-phosphatase
MKRAFLALATAAALATGVAHAAANDVDGTFGRLDHVFLIMMENQTNTDILGNPNLPFINSYVNVANFASDYFAVGHPSAPNYLEIIGGSNFGLTNDYWPNWVGTGCTDNAPGSTGCLNALTPIADPGVDNAVVATVTNPLTQCNGQISFTGTPAPNNCALYNYPAKPFTPRSIADQLTDRGMTWKTYQESLPIVTPGVFGVNYSDGAFTNLSSASVFGPGPIQKLYAVKHNPFAYFRNVEEGSLDQVVDFDGQNGLWAVLQSKDGDDLPNFMFIVPNQCHDMHGFVSGGTPICSTSTPAESAFLLSIGDAEVEKLITGIKASPAWQHGRNVIVLLWDENDYSNAPNHVVMTVETNYARNGRVSDKPYDHFSMLKTLEAGFGLPCLNHACDATSHVMNFVFGGERHELSNR